MKAIGGYISPGLLRDVDLKPNTIRLNTGRNALECVLRLRRYRVLYVPRYTCGVLREPLKNLGIEPRYYDIDPAFEPLFDTSSLSDEEGLLYTNYFGLKDDTIRRLAITCPTLIVDQAQAFYAVTPAGVEAFDSARKFHAVPDGAHLTFHGSFEIVLDQDSSSDRMEHLAEAGDQGVEAGYAAYLRNEAKLSELPARSMSRLTQALLSATDHQAVIARRRANHAILHEALRDLNELCIDPSSSAVPFAYPFLSKKKELRNHLIRNKVFVPTYWPDLLGEVTPGSIEATFRDRLNCLPIDQRFGAVEMQKLIAIIQAQI